jgi:hypothetical protein
VRRVAREAAKAAKEASARAEIEDEDEDEHEQEDEQEDEGVPSPRPSPAGRGRHAAAGTFCDEGVAATGARPWRERFSVRPADGLFPAWR